MIQEICHAAVSAVFPGLSLERYSAWRLGRRLTSAALVGLMLLGAAPARAQTTDVPAFWQRIGEYAKTAYREVKGDLQWAQSNFKTDYWALQQLMCSYQDYQNGIKLYQRVTNPNTSINLIQGMPLLDVYGAGLNGEDHYILRPVFRPAQRLNPPKLASINFGGFEDLLNALKSGSLSFDLDHFTVVKRADDANLSPEQLALVSVQDAWANWRQAQTIVKVDENLYDIPFDATTYFGLTQEVQLHFNRRMQALQQTAQFLSARGSDDPVYQQALQAMADLQKIMGNGTSQQTAADIADRLLRIDAQATQVVTIAARLRMAVGEVAKRQSARHDNLQTLKQTYGPADAPFSFTQWFNQLGADAKKPSKEQLSASMMANTHADATATTAEEALKHNLTNQLEAQNQKFHEYASQKAQALAELRGTMGDAYYGEQIKLLNLEVQQDTAMARLRLILARVPSPTNVPVRVPDQLSSIPGTVSASSPTTVSDPGTTIATALPDKLSARVDAVTNYVAASKTLSLGVLAPVFQGIDAGAKAATGKAFNLSSWGVKTNG